MAQVVLSRVPDRPPHPQGTNAAATTSTPGPDAVPDASPRRGGRLRPGPARHRRHQTTTATVPARMHRLTITAGNARALLRHKPDVSRRKERHVQRLLLRADVLLLQKLHGDLHAQRAALMRMGATHTAWSSAMASSSAGGVATLLSNRILCAARSTSTYEIVSGRVLGPLADAR